MKTGIRPRKQWNTHVIIPEEEFNDMVRVLRHKLVKRGPVDFSLQWTTDKVKMRLKSGYKYQTISVFS
jgi:hypothetical protein